MIFVTLGTQDKPFNRLLDIIEKNIKNGNIKDKVIVQAGNTEYESNYMEVHSLLSQDKYEEYIQKCDFMITHGGVGNILTGLKYNKKIIAAPRLSIYGEHTNDHQIQIINEFYNKGYILKLIDFNDLDSIIKKIDKFKPKKYISNTENFCEKLKKEIDNL